MSGRYLLVLLLAGILFISSCGPGLQEAQKFYEEKKYDEALSLLRRIVRDDPEDYEAHLLMAKIYKLRENMPNALYHLKKCIEQKPDDFATKLDYGNLLIEAEKYREGAEILDSIKEQIQGDKVSLNNLGRGYLYTGKFEEAQKVLQQVLKMAPDYPDVHLNLGILAYRMRDYESALQRLEEAMNLDKENAEVQFNLGLTLGKLGKNDEMEKAFRKAIYINSRMEDAYLYLGRYLMEQGNFGDAAEIFDELLFYVEGSSEGKKYLDQVTSKLNWPVFRRNNGRTNGFGRDVNPPCRIKWETWIGGNLQFSPITIGAALFVVDNNRVVAIQPKSGKQAWIRPLDSTIVTDLIAVSPYVFVCEKKKLSAVEMKFGGIKWEHAVDGELNIPPIYHDESLYLLKSFSKGDAGGIVLDVVATDNGNLISSYPLFDDPASRCMGSAVIQDYLYAVLLTARGGIILAIDLLSGEIVWRQEISDCKFDPCFSDNAIFLSTQGNNVVAYDMENGDMMWDHECGGIIHSNLLWSEYKVFASHRTPGGKFVLCSLADESGETDWQFEFALNATQSASSESYISMAGENILWTFSGGDILIVESSKGQKMMEYRSPSPSVSPASLLDGRFYINTRDGFVYAFEHGEPLPESQQQKAASQIKKRVVEGKKELAGQIKGRLLAFSITLRMVVDQVGDWTGGFDITVKNDNDFPLTNVQVVLDSKYIYSKPNDSKGKSLKFIDIGHEFVVNTLECVTAQGQTYQKEGKPTTLQLLSDQGKGFTKLNW